MNWQVKKEEVMNWHSPFSVSAFTPRVSSTTLDSSASTDSSPEQVSLVLICLGSKTWKVLDLSLPSQLKLSGASGSSGDSDVPLSRTHTYKKITKPLLERKRRARINKCLDELKDIMTGNHQHKKTCKISCNFYPNYFVAALDIF